LVKCNLTKLTTTSLAVKLSTVKRFINLAVKRFISLAVKWFISLAVKWFTHFSGQALHKLSGQAVIKLSGQTVRKLSGQAVPGGVLVEIFGGGVPPISPNPDPISDQKMPFLTPVFRPGLKKSIPVFRPHLVRD